MTDTERANAVRRDTLWTWSKDDLIAEIRRLRREGCYPLPRTDWAGMNTCNHCGQTWAVGSHIIGSTTHVCPQQSDGREA